MKLQSSIATVLASSPFNLVINNLFWAGCVVGRYDMLWFVAPAVISYALFLVISKNVQPVQLLWPLTIGILIDSFFTATGFFQFPQGNLFLPLWMCILWLSFATTIPMSLRPIGNNVYLAAIIGAVGFPFTYLLGEKLGAVSFALPSGWTVLILAATWSIALPILFNCVMTTSNRLSSERL